MTERRQIQPNMIITMELQVLSSMTARNMNTLISPLLPSIVKVLQKEEQPKDLSSEPEKTATTTPPSETATSRPEVPKERHMSAFILIAIITGLFVIVAVGTTTLFKNQPVVTKEVVATDKALTDVLKAYPSVKFSFNKATGQLVIFGHLLTAQDRTQLLYSIQELPFIRSIDDSGLIIDEYVWQEINPVLNKNSDWKSITLQSPAAGQFVLSGSLQTRKQAEQLYDYISSNFSYLDRLEKKVIVEEDLLVQAKNILEGAGLFNLQTSYRAGELLIQGGVPAAKQAAFDAALKEIEHIQGVNLVRTQINPIAPDQDVINISNRYEVTGFSRVGNSISVIINGRIVTQGDVLDGMVIQKIVQGSVFLEKDNVKYRIDFSK